MIGQTISHYRIVERLGGGMGVVYKAEDSPPAPFRRPQVYKQAHPRQKTAKGERVLSWKV